MIFKNSIKILFSNFSIVWKSLVYLFFISLISVVCAYFSLRPIYELLATSGLFESISDIYTSFITTLNLAQFFVALGDLLASVCIVLTSNMVSVWVNIVCFVVVMFIFKTIASNLVMMANCECLNYYMGSMNRASYFHEFGSVLGKNIKVQLCYYLISMPIKLFIIAICFLESRLIGGGLLQAIVTVFLLVLTFAILVSLKYTLMATWIPTVVIKNYGVFRALGASLKLSFRKFGRIFANALGVVLVIYFINVFFGLFTFFVGLLITIPASYLLYCVFGMVTVYDCQGMRYYVDVYNVISPAKKERSDKLKQMKYIV